MITYIYIIMNDMHILCVDRPRIIYTMNVVYVARPLHHVWYCHTCVLHMLSGPPIAMLRVQTGLAGWRSLSRDSRQMLPPKLPDAPSQGSHMSVRCMLVQVHAMQCAMQRARGRALTSTPTCGASILFLRVLGHRYRSPHVGVKPRRSTAYKRS